MTDLKGTTPSERSQGVTSRLIEKCSTLTTDSQGGLEDWIKDSLSRNEHKVEVPPLPWYTILIVVGVGFGLVTIASKCNVSLPRALKIVDEQSNQGKFIAERAHNHLQQLVSTKGRMTGSHENEVLAVNFLTREIGFIKQRALPTHNILVDVHKSKGCAYLGEEYGYTSCFDDVTNVVVQLSTQETIKSKKCLLLNCHFDSAPKSPGASAASQCVVMLELLEVLSRTPGTLHNTITFLFNGAKESYQQGALSFVTKHPWAKHVNGLINLDAFGVGGREMVFQQHLVHPWLLQAYCQSVPHPHGLVLMEEAFYYLMTDFTDYNIFTEFGKIPGLGLGHFTGGFVYRTSHDLVAAVSPESLQHTGDNMLALVMHVAYSNVFPDIERHAAGTPVYFDLFGLYMVAYSKFTSVAVNLATVCFAAVIFTKQIKFLYKRYGDKATRMYLRRCVVGNVASHVTGTLIAYTLARIAIIAGKPTHWYTHSWMIYLLYFGPVIVSQMTFTLFIDRSRSAAIPLLIGAQVALLSQHLLVTSTLLLGTVANLRLSYLPMLVLLFPSLAMYLMNVGRYNQSDGKWIVGYLLGLLLPLVIAVYHMVAFFDAIIPAYGRLMQPTAMPDLRIAVLSALWCCLLTSHLTSLVVLVKDSIKVWCGFIYLRILIFLLLTFTSLMAPFAVYPLVPRLQKMNVYHTDRAFYNAMGGLGRSDAGYWIIPSDQNCANNLMSVMHNLKPIIEVSEDCKEKVYCGMPIFEPQHLDEIPWSFWVKAQPPVVHYPTSIQLEQRKMLSLSVRRLKFDLRGPNHMVLLVSPGPKNRLIKWSFSDVVPPLEDSNGFVIPALVVTYTRGMGESSLKFWMDFQISDGNLTATSVDIVVVGHYMHSNHGNTQPFIQFLQQFPPWIHITSWTSTYKSWSF